MKCRFLTLFLCCMISLIVQSVSASTIPVCDGLFSEPMPTLQTVLPPSYEQVQPHPIPTEDSLYSVMDFQKMAYFKSFESFEEWNKSLEQYFLQELPQLPADQVIFISDETLKLVLKAHLQAIQGSQTNESSTNLLPSQLSIFFKNLLTFWKHQNSFSDSDRNFAKVAIFEIILNTLPRHLPEDSALIRFMFANDFHQFEITETLKTSYPGPSAFRFSQLTFSDIQLRKQLLYKIASRPSTSPFLRQYELLLLTYISNELRALSIQMNSKEIAAVLIDYEDALQKIDQLRIKPFSGQFDLPGSMSNYKWALNSLMLSSKLASDHLPNDFTKSMIEVAHRIQNRLKKQFEKKQKKSTQLLAQYRSRPEALWNRHEEIFQNFPIGVLVKFIQNIPNRHNQKEWVIAYYEYIKTKNDFQRAIHDRNILIDLHESYQQ